MITIGGSDFIVRYPMAAIKKLNVLFENSKISEGNFSAEDIATVIFVGLEYGDNPMRMEKLEEELDLSHLAHYSEVLEEALGGKAMAAKARKDAAAAAKELAAVRKKEA